MEEIKLAVIDMTGTSVRDDKEIETCYYNAALKTGLKVSRDEIRQYLGLPQEEVISALWKTKMDGEDPDLEKKVAMTSHLFRAIVQNHYVLKGARAAEGAMDTFKWLRAEGIYIAITTDLSRKVANSIFEKLDWGVGLDEDSKSKQISIIDLLLTPEDVDGKGNPHPDMILKAMDELGVKDSKKVIRLGDTPYDLRSGKAAKCLLSLAVCNGAFTREELAAEDNDGLLDDIGQLRETVSARLESVKV